MSSTVLHGQAGDVGGMNPALTLGELSLPGTLEAVTYCMRSAESVTSHVWHTRSHLAKAVCSGAR